ncbi:MAG: DUF3108 domain-containing protein [Marinobacter sp.]|nr:DUF3108 domain-containing protein [Marinobacter sp.]
MTYAVLRQACLALVLTLFGICTSHAQAADTTPQKAAETPADQPAPVPPASPLSPVSVSYTASIDKGIELNGSATRSLEHLKDGTWLVRFNVDSFVADIRETLHFRWQDNRVVPLAYHYRLSGLLIRDRENKLDYDWDKHRVSGKVRGKSFTMDAPDGALDPLGYQLQLREDLRAGKKEMAYQVTDKARYETSRFAVIGQEKLATELGKLDTLKVEKVRAPDSKRETLMWFAPDKDYLLVRLVQVETDGTRYEINIKKADLSP